MEIFYGMKKNILIGELHVFIIVRYILNRVTFNFRNKTF